MMTFVRRFWKNKGTTIGIGLLLIFAVVPIAWCLAYAIACSFGLIGFSGSGLTFRYWAQSIADGEMPRSFLFSTWIAAATIASSASIALFLVLAFRRVLQNRRAASFLYFPLALSGLVAAFLVSRILGGAGLLSRIAFAVHLVREPGQFPSLVNDAAGIGIIAAHCLLAAPFLAILMLQIYETENIERMGELALSLGASRWQCIRRVTIPVLLQRSSPTLVLYFIFVFGSFEIPLVVGPQNPLMISMLTRKKFALFNLAERPEAFVISIVYTALVILLLGVALKKKAASHD